MGVRLRTSFFKVMTAAVGGLWSAPACGGPRGEIADSNFSTLYKTWHPAVSSWVRRFGAPEGELEDLVQDVFVIVCRRLPAFDGRDVAGWLYQITRHRVRDFRRSSWFRRRLSSHDTLTNELTEAVPSRASNPAQALETREACTRAEKLLLGLGETERAALLLFEVHGASGRQIAARQGIPLNTVWSRIGRARGKLAAAWAE
jgi:RNA polymerase sigma-70 factor (ECF subfamily)